jgi:DNA-binding winged helix-turn-helix (wHTH) protein/tetratricopeptide (TPR) repeat protein
VSSPVYRFESFRLLPATRELWRGDEALTLPLKVFECIAYLVEHRDRAVGRDELMAAVWGQVDLSDGALGQTIRLARQVLGDTGDEQRFIRTVRGFGYHWGAAVAVEAPPADVGDPSPSPAPPPAPQAPSRSTMTGADAHAAPSRRRLAALAAVLALVLLVAALAWVRSPADPPHPAAIVPQTGEIALLLPVRVDADASSEWLRLGAMDLIAQRLRHAGQAVVPSDTVIALVRQLPETPSAAELDLLAARTGAAIILSSRAVRTGARWTVSIHSVLGPEPALTSVGEAHDALEASTMAADALAAQLGLEPGIQDGRPPALQLLLRQIEAARLAQQHALAQSLVENADPSLDAHPELRFQRVRLRFYAGELEAARGGFEALRAEVDPAVDPLLHARVLNGLAAIHAIGGRPAQAQQLLQEAADLVGGEAPPELPASIHMNLGNLAQEQGDFRRSRRHMAEARRLAEAVGDVRSLAEIDFNVGVLETRLSRYGEAVRRFRLAADRRAAMQAPGDELHARSYVVLASRWRMDAAAMRAEAPHLARLQAQVGSPRDPAALALARAELLLLEGDTAAARQLLETTLGEVTGEVARANLLVRLADSLLAEDPQRADALAGEAVALLPSDPGRRYDVIRARAGLLQVRAALVRQAEAEAALAAHALAQWRRDSVAPAVAVAAQLALSEIAHAHGQHAEAEAAFEGGWRIAIESGVPLHLFWALESRIPQLLESGDQAPGARQDALALVDWLGDRVDHDFDTALLQLRVYAAVGPVSAWRQALSRVESLAGDRRVPPSLLVPPGALAPP